MFQSLNRVVFQVPDLEEAKKWYIKILGKEPVFDSPIFASFQIGDSLLILLPKSLEEGTAIPYWGVDDVRSAYKVLLKAGAVPHSQVKDILGTTVVASVSDPFGNIIGIVGTALDAARRSVEFEPSVTAMEMALMRALAAADERPEIRGQDYLAEIFLTDMHKKMIRNPSAHTWLLYGMRGRYEFHIARTAYFDSIVLEALTQNIPQIVFLGAGYDSRPYRFRNRIKDTRIFELDVPTTQNRKKEKLHSSGIPVPENLIFVPINFKTDKFDEVLAGAGYDDELKTLFIWEGVSYYLSEKSVNDTLVFIKINSPPGSTICFDYMIDTYVDRANLSSAALHPGEPFKFGVGEGKIETFLREKGYIIIEHMSAHDMQKRYLCLRDGTYAGKVRSGICLVHASTEYLTSS